MWNLGGTPQGHVYTEECTASYLLKRDGNTLVSVSYSGRYYKQAEIQDGELKAVGEHGFGKYSSFHMPLNKLIEAVKLLKPSEVTHADSLAKKVIGLGKSLKFLEDSNLFDLEDKDKVKFTVVLDANDPMKSSAEALLSFKLTEAAGLDKNPEAFVINVIAQAIISNSKPNFPESFKGVTLYKTCDGMVLQFYKEHNEEKELTNMLAKELKQLAPAATVKVEKATRKDHPEFDDFHGDVHFFKVTVDELESYLAFGANQTTPAYIYYN